LLTCRVTTADPYGPLFMLFRSQKIKQHKSVGVLIVCQFLTSQSWRDKWDTCHGSTISSADCLRKLNHAQKVGQLYRSSDAGLSLRGGVLLFCSAVEFWNWIWNFGATFLTWLCWFVSLSLSVCRSLLLLIIKQSELHWWSKSSWIFVKFGKFVRFVLISELSYSAELWLVNAYWQSIGRGGI